MPGSGQAWDARMSQSGTQLVELMVMVQLPEKVSILDFSSMRLADDTGKKFAPLGFSHSCHEQSIGIYYPLDEGLTLMKMAGEMLAVGNMTRPKGHLDVAWLNSDARREPIKVHFAFEVPAGKTSFTVTSGQTQASNGEQPTTAQK